MFLQTGCRVAFFLYEVALDPNKIIMIRICFLFILAINIGCSKPPDSFPEIVLQDTLEDQNGNVLSVAALLKKYEKKTIFIDIWASWCRDCIINFPKVNALKENHPEIAYVFLSVDHQKRYWHKGITKFGLSYGDHYLIQKGWKKSELCEFLDVDWIPRYMVIDPNGKIIFFKIIDASDINLIKYLDTL